MSSAAVRAEPDDLDRVPQRAKAALPRGRRDPLIEPSRGELHDTPARLTNEVVVMRGSARRVTHAAHAGLDAVNAREGPERDKEVQRPEHGRSPHAALSERADELLRGERRATSQCSNDHVPSR